MAVFTTALDLFYNIFVVSARENRPIDLPAELEKMRAAYHKHPYRKDNFPHPTFLETDRLSKLYEEKEEIFAHGEVYYAYIVQANSILFRFFPQLDCPAQIVYSPDERLNRDPRQLQQIAGEIYSYKNQPLDQIPEFYRSVVAAVKDEYNRNVFCGTFILPEGAEVPVYCATIMIFRKFLPYRQLIGSLFPVVAMPGKKDTVLTLPKKYWSKRFIKRHWSDPRFAGQL